VAARAWPPMREMDQLRRDFDEILDRFLGHRPGPTHAEAAIPEIEAYVEDDRLVVRADLPGVEASDVEVSIEGECLVIRGTRKEKREQKEREFRLREVSYGDFERRIAVPAGIHAEDVNAAYRDGVLELTMALPQVVAGRAIKIEVEGSRSDPVGAIRSEKSRP
jgi:HSP20 family protein